MDHSFSKRWGQKGQYTVRESMNPLTNAPPLYRTWEIWHPKLPFISLIISNAAIFYTHMLQNWTERQTFETLAKQALPQINLISKIYRLPTKPLANNPGQHFYMSKWNGILQHHLSPTNWSEIWEKTRQMITFARLK